MAVPGGACCACCARTSRIAHLQGAMAAPAQAPIVMKEAMLVRAKRRKEKSEYGEGKKDERTGNNARDVHA